MRLRYLLSFAFVVVLLDQFFKFFFAGKTYSLFGFNIISYTENTGAAFSVLEGYRWLFVAVALSSLVVIFCYVILIKSSKLSFEVSLGLLIGGIFGNLVDRIFFGYVRDFINLDFWPTFNLADAVMFLSLAYLVFHVFKHKELVS